MSNDKTHFGYETVAEQEKARRVADVFDSVASRYDLMNDLMSGGMHRLWKAFTIQRSGVREGSRVLDVAGGTGDLSWPSPRRSAKRPGLADRYQQRHAGARS
jgi:demethylmenaquinone methyltransferase/2-methoxy-6-polyprenyl-1,4-benzoquinol methylase